MNFITPINNPEPTVKIWSRDEFNNVLDEFYDLFEIAFRESINRYIDEGKLLALDSEALEYRTEKSEIAEFFFDSYFKAGKIFADVNQLGGQQFSSDDVKAMLGKCRHHVGHLLERLKWSAYGFGEIISNWEVASSKDISERAARLKAETQSAIFAIRNFFNRA